MADLQRSQVRRDPACLRAALHGEHRAMEKHDGGHPPCKMKRRMLADAMGCRKHTAAMAEHHGCTLRRCAYRHGTAGQRGC